MIASAGRAGFVTLHVPWGWWAGAGGVITALLVIDILLLHNEAAISTTKRAVVESCAWIAIGLSAGLAILAGFGGKAAGEYYSGYLIELSLSMDNVFVWALILTFFAVPRAYQHRVLFWGIFGAVILRAIFVFAGVALINRFDFLLFVFGGFLVFTAIKLLTKSEQEVDPSQNKILKLVNRVVPSTDQYDGQKLFTRVGKKRLATPLFAVLVLIEATDVLFAVDSVPAVLAVSREQFIVLTSNAFAILGLRALYALLADLKDRFEYLPIGLAVILAFVGVKMIISKWVHIPTPISLGVIFCVLAIAIGVSMRSGEHDSREES